MNEPKHRSPFVLVGRLIVLVKPMLPIMLAAIVMGVAGYFCATFITFRRLCILRALGWPARCARWALPLPAFWYLPCCAASCAMQSRLPTIIFAFKLLALIRDQVFGALRRLTPGQAGGP